MSQKIVYQMIDDLSGETSDDTDVETVTFALDGVTYHIDLGEKNAEALRDVLGDYIAVARRAGKGGTASRKPARRRDVTGETTMTREMSQAARQWARQQGWDVPSRGRLPRTITDAYREHLASL